MQCSFTAYLEGLVERDVVDVDAVQALTHRIRQLPPHSGRVSLHAVLRHGVEVNAAHVPPRKHGKGNKRTKGCIR